MATLPPEQRALYGCPSWCTEEHDHRDLMFGDTTHDRALLHVVGGAYVGLTQRGDGPARLVCDPGPGHHTLSPTAARRFAAAILTAANLAIRTGR